MKNILLNSFEKSYKEIKNNIEDKLENMNDKIIPIIEEISFSIINGAEYIIIKKDLMKENDIMDIGVINVSFQNNEFWIGNLIEPLGKEICMNFMTQDKKYDYSMKKNFQLFYDSLQCLEKNLQKKVNHLKCLCYHVF
jgi:hypothetical protein